RGCFDYCGNTITSFVDFLNQCLFYFRLITSGNTDSTYSFLRGRFIMLYKFCWSFAAACAEGQSC
ncbi:MAG: hypothetical protein Q8L68_07315, partial [Methylococcales bacterium]|nr:hypothetical protein [Methylococcales bacterium]